MEHESIELLSQYLRINTTNPPGNEAAAAQFFAEILDREGIKYRTYEPEVGRVSLRAAIPGSGRKKPVILLNHMDVVPANAEEWSFDPFGGEIKDGYVHGRGALDMKGQGIMELLAFLAVKREGIKPCRDLIFLSVADEESGGQKGIGYLLEKYPEDFAADLVINEGAYGVTGFIPDRPVFMISTAEKGICWLKVTSTGPPGHASVPHGHNALEKLNMALSRLFSEGPPLTITPIISDYFKNLGAWWDDFKPFLNDGRPETLSDILAKSGLLNIPHISAMVRNTVSLTQIHSGNKTNVIPSQAVATLDVRLLPGESVDSQIQYIKKKMDDDNLTFKVVASGLPTESSKDTEYFSLIRETVLDYFSNAIVTPSLLFASSDSRFFREREITTYGFAPILVSMEDIKMIHGLDERISVDNVIKGTEVYTELVKRMCSV